MIQKITRRDALKYTLLATGALALRWPGSSHGASAADRITFALLSDNHLGRTGDKDIEQLQTAIEEINNTGVQQVIFCGDLVNAGEKTDNQKHYATWKSLARKLSAPWIAVPGNHDPVDIFRQHIAPQTDAVVDHPPYRFITFADAKPNPAHDGIVTPQQINWITSKITEAKQKNLKVILVSHITHHDNRTPNRGWKIETGREHFSQLLSDHAGTVVAFIAGHFHFGLHGWQDTADGATKKLAQIVLPSTSWNEDAHLKNHVDWLVEDHRPAYVLAEATPERMILRHKPVGGEVLTTREIAF
ncbi:MAG TPA: metallophosphoesterase [Tepidisphaeraceae bacterium]|jgi:Icc-related predicted phosphoesterase